MPAPAADRATAAATAPSASTSGDGGPKINPLTGLSTDYLNHFTEAVMVLDMAATTPECLNELRTWRPRTYAEHFAASRFSNRTAIVAAYRAADPAVRDALDRGAEMLSALVQRTHELMLQHAGDAEAGPIARRSQERLRPLLARVAAVINGTVDEMRQQGGPQAAVDAMFAR